MKGLYLCHRHPGRPGFIFEYLFKNWEGLTRAAIGMEVSTCHRPDILVRL